MSSRKERIEVDIRSIFKGGFIPPGLERFAEDAGRALDDLLLSRALLAHLNPADTVELLLDWFDAAGPEFIEAVDRALADWIESAWGKPVLPESGQTSTLTAEAWIRACDLIAAEPRRLSRAAAALRGKMPEGRSFLAALREGPARDPEGRAWRALARSQKRGKQADRSLIDEWWQLCRLDPGVPWFHGELGIEGLRWIEPSDEAKVKAGGFPAEVGEGLLSLAKSMIQRVREGWLEERFAREEWQRMVRLTESAYPSLSVRWVAFWREALMGRRAADDRVREWVRTTHREELNSQGSRGSASLWMNPDPEWADRAAEIARALQRGEARALKRAEVLLRQQQTYAEATGETFFFVRSACNLATAIKKTNPEKALEWVERARHLDPSNDHAWTLTANLRVELGQPEEGQRFALRAVELFPENPVAHSTLVETLRAQERYEEAEAVYLEGIARFPEDAPLAASLGEIYKAQGRFEAAENAFRVAIENVPDDPSGSVGLAELYRVQGRYREAKEQLERVLDVWPGEPFARSTLRAIEREERQQEVAEPVTEYKSGSTSAAEKVTTASLDELRPADVEILVQDTYLLRRWQRRMAPSDESLPGELRDRARELLRALEKVGARYSTAAGEQGLLELELDDLENALALLREAADRFPGSARVRYALARAERLRIEREKPEINLGEITRPWRRLSRIAESLEPVGNLGLGRTWLALANGSLPPEAEHGARDAFGRLGHWIEHVLEAERVESEKQKRSALSNLSFLGSQARRLRHDLFGDEVIAGFSDLDDLKPIHSRLLADPRHFDDIEETFVRRLAV